MRRGQEKGRWMDKSTGERGRGRGRREGEGMKREVGREAKDRWWRVGWKGEKGGRT